MTTYRDHWWQAKKDEDIHDGLMTTAQRLDDSLEFDPQFTEWLKPLLNRNYGELKPGSANFSLATLPRKSSIKINALQNITETLISRICTSRPRPRFVTEDGNWRQKRRAQKLDRFIQGVFQRSKTYRHAAMAFRDAAWCGTGIIKTFIDQDGWVSNERVFPANVLVDQQACFQGQPPRDIYHREWVAADVLCAQYPKLADKIRLAAQRESTYTEDHAVTDIVKVVEGWHLPSGNGEKDGRHAIAVDGVTLFSEVWEDDFLPFAFLRWTDLPVGFYGQGLVEQLLPIQAEINKNVQLIQRAVQKFGVTWIVAPEGCMPKNSISNEMGKILWVKPGDEKSITVHNPLPMNPQVFQWVDWLYLKEHEISAVSKASASAQAQSNVRSAEHQRELRDEQTERFGMLVRGWENFILDVAENDVNTARRTYMDNDEVTDFQVRYADKGVYQSIKWADVNMDRDAYVLQLWPSNLLPATPAGRLATTEELMNIGLIDVQTAGALLDFPDVSKTKGLLSTTVDYADWAVEQLFDGKDPPVPMGAVAHLPTILSRLGQHYMQAIMDGATEEETTPLRHYIEGVAKEVAAIGQARKTLAEMEAMKQQQQQQGGPAQPGAPISAMEKGGAPA